jgi:hypothetical protein
MTTKRKRGGKQPNAGRKRDLSSAQREEIALEFRHRMKAQEAAIALVRDPVRKERQKVYRRLHERSERFASGQPPQHDLIKFDAELRALGGAGLRDDDPPYRPQPAPFKRPKGYRKAFIKAIAKEKTEEYEITVTQRMVERCIAEFDFGK